jgi:hypothetical protein
MSKANNFTFAKAKTSPNDTERQIIHLAAEGQSLNLYNNSPLRNTSKDLVTQGTVVFMFVLNFQEP